MRNRQIHNHNYLSIFIHFEVVLLSAYMFRIVFGFWLNLSFQYEIFSCLSIFLTVFIAWYYCKVKVKVKSLSCVQLFATRWTVAHQAPPSMGFSRQEYWSGLPFPSPDIIIAMLNFCYCLFGVSSFILLFSIYIFKWISVESI